MRVISQDGCYDIPYEQAMLLRYGNRIHLMSQNFAGVERIISDPVIAEYSTEEKAIKAMEMCKDKYLSRMELYGGYDMVNRCYVQPNYWVLPKVFQFPADEDIEV